MFTFVPDKLVKFARHRCRRVVNPGLDSFNNANPPNYSHSISHTLRGQRIRVVSYRSSWTIHSKLLAIPITLSRRLQQWPAIRLIPSVSRSRGRNNPIAGGHQILLPGRCPGLYLCRSVSSTKPQPLPRRKWLL